MNKFKLYLSIPICFLVVIVLNHKVSRFNKIEMNLKLQYSYKWKK